MLSEELDILLNKYKYIIPDEVGSDNITEDSSYIDEINPEDSISNIGNKVNKEGKEIYNIEGQIKILNGNIIEININPKGEIKEILENYNKELKIYNELKEELKNKIKNIDNKEYQNIISKYEKEKLKIIESNNLETEKLKELYEKNKKYIELDVENRYKNKIKILEDNLENIKNQTEREYKIRLEYEEARNKELEEIKIKLEKDKDQLLILTNKKAQTKGVEGELEIYNYIKSKIELNEKSKIENVSKDKKESSDLYLEHNKIKCVIEIKNHNSAIQKNDIKKFEEVYINQEKYNSGLFISLASDFSPSSGKSDFEIKIINNKPILYISNINENKDKLIIAIKILNYIISNKEEYNFDKILNLLKIQISNYSNLTKKLIDINQLVNSTILETKKYKKQIDDILEIEEEDNNIKPEKYNIDIKSHYTNIDSEINNIQCNYCNQKAYANNSRGITHFKKHLINKHNIK